MILLKPKAHIKANFKAALAVFFIFPLFVCLFPETASGGVIIRDIIVLNHQKVMLRAKTTGKIFAKGGQIVEFFVDGESVGKTLSGGDGVAFKSFTPMKIGLYQTRAASGEDKSAGLLFSLKKDTRIVFIDVEGSLLQMRFSTVPKKGSQKAVEEIYKKFTVVFLQTGFFGVTIVKAWLKKNNFPELPVVPWRQGAIFQEITENGLRIHAVIGSSNVIESAKDYNGRSFSFNALENSELVKDWMEVIEKLK